jgi:hypothetical protein
MAKETKAQRDARIAAEISTTLEEQKKTYFSKLMAALEEATTLNNYELTIRDGMFSLRDRETAGAITFSVSFTENDWYALDNLSWELRVKADARDAAERNYRLRQSALAKLSDDERKALGL